MRKKPIELKIVTGTDRPDRREAPGVELPPLVSIPEPPNWLSNAYAIAEWRRLAPVLVANRLLTEASISVLAALCSAYAEVIKCARGESPPNAALFAQFRALMGEFGLTPATRSRVRTEPAADPKNRFSRFLERTNHE